MELVDRFTPLALSLIGKFARGRPWLRDELASEAALALFKAATTWRADGGSAFITWATIYIRCALIQRVKRELRIRATLTSRMVCDVEGHEVSAVDLEADHRHPQPDDAAELADDLAALPALLATLPTERQELLLRYIAKDESSTTIAAEQGVTPQAIRDRVSRDLAKLWATATVGCE